MKAIFLDADETLIDLNQCEREALAHTFNYLGLDFNDTVQPAFHGIDRNLWDGSARMANMAAHRFKLLFDELEIDCIEYDRANELFKEGLRATNAVMDDALELVRELHSRGYMLCVITNGRVDLQHPRVENSVIGQYISHIIESEEVGAPKPNPLISNTMLARLGLSAGEVIMVGDSLEKDVAGAQAAGIRAVWFNPHGTVNASGVEPDYEIRGLPELIKLL